jgi:hypothetical protein
MIYEVRNLKGVVLDQPGWQIPKEYVTVANNIRKADGQLGSFAGHTEYFVPTVSPYYIIPVTDGSTYFWLYCGTAKAYLYDGGTHYEITNVGGDYTGDENNLWNGCIINGVPVVNNGIDPPQMFTPISTTTDLADLTAWDATWKAKVIRQYKNFLFALNITKGSTEYPHMVKWSDVADSGGVPTTWDETVATNLAGETTLSETDGILVDAEQLKNELIIYKEDAVFSAQLIKGIEVFRFRRIKGLGGLLAQGCVAEYPDGHFVVGGSVSRDIYVHDGQTAKSVCSGIIQDAFFSELDTTHYKKSFVVHQSAKKEMWVFYPTTGSTLPNKALIWNYESNDWTFRDVPERTAHASVGVVTSAIFTWDTLPYATWDEWTGRWGERTFSSLIETIVSSTTDSNMAYGAFSFSASSSFSGVANTIAGEAVASFAGTSDFSFASTVTTSRVYKFEDGRLFAGVSPRCTIERDGIKLAEYHSMATEVHPFIEGDSVDVYVGATDSINGTYSWEGPYTFDPGADHKIDCRVSGKYHSVRFETTESNGWAISGYHIEHKPAGKR